MLKRWKLTLNAPAVLVFSSLCILATLLGAVTGGAASRLLFSTYAAPLTDPLLYVRLFTHVIGHSGMDHLLGNLAYILLLGPILEEKYGSRRLVLLILLTGLITAVIHNLFFPGTMLLGASGVVFAFILLTSFTDFQEGEIPLTFVLVAVIYLGRQIWDGITVRDHVSNLSHIIGGLVGSVGGYVLNLRMPRHHAGRKS